MSGRKEFVYFLIGSQTSLAVFGPNDYGTKEELKEEVLMLANLILEFTGQPTLTREERNYFDICNSWVKSLNYKFEGSQN